MPLEAQDHLAYKECQEKEEVLETLDQKGRGYAHTCDFMLGLPESSLWLDFRGADCVAVLLI